MFVKTLGIMLLISLAGCSWINKEFKADPVANAGFLKDEKAMSKHSERFPFNKIWCAPENCDWEKYTEIMVAPVDTSHLVKMSWWESVSLEPRKELQQERHIIANYMKQQFEKAFREDSRKKYRIVSKPSDKTMIIELALVQLVPTKSFLNVMSDVAGFFVPGSGLISLTGTGSVAIEGRLRDAKTKKVFFKFADHENDRSSPINLANLTWHSHAKEIVDDWAKQMVELSDTPASQQIKDSSIITLRLW